MELVIMSSPGDAHGGWYSN